MRPGGRGAGGKGNPGARRRQFAYDLLPELIGYNLRQAQVAVFEDFAAAMDAVDITPGQFGVLCLIAANPGLNQSDLGAVMGVDRSTVVATIDRMERRHWAARRPAPGDRRSYALELTAEGHQLLETLKPRVLAHERRIARALSPAEQGLLIDLLRRIAHPAVGVAEVGEGSVDGAEGDGGDRDSSNPTLAKGPALAKRKPPRATKADQQGGIVKPL